jgi:hypothetical protein
MCSKIRDRVNLYNNSKEPAIEMLQYLLYSIIWIQIYTNIGIINGYKTQESNNKIILHPRTAPKIQSENRIYFFGDFLCFNATFSNISTISWRPVLVVEEVGENHRPWASNW